MAQIYLEGNISKFGDCFPVKPGASVRDVMRIIGAQVPGFREYLVELAESGAGFTIQHGADFLEEKDLLLSLTQDDLILTEVPAGSKGGKGKILAAIAIVAVVAASGGFGGGGIFGGGGLVSAPGSTIGQSGQVLVSTGLGTTGKIAIGIATNLALSGISELLAPGPETDSAEINNAALFGGPVNGVAQGTPVPIAYGELIVGGTSISVSYSSSPIKPSVHSAATRVTPNANPATADFSTNIYNGNPPLTSAISSGSFPAFSYNDFVIEENLRG